MTNHQVKFEFEGFRSIGVAAILKSVPFSIFFRKFTAVILLNKNGSKHKGQNLLQFCIVKKCLALSLHKNGKNNSVYITLKFSNTLATEIHAYEGRQQRSAQQISRFQIYSRKRQAYPFDKRTTEKGIVRSLKHKMFTGRTKASNLA